jgi:hypothetical protein
MLLRSLYTHKKIGIKNFQNEFLLNFRKSDPEEHILYYKIRTVGQIRMPFGMVMGRDDVHGTARYQLDISCFH